MKKIVVASQNPVKINTTLSGFKRMMPNEEFEVEGVSVASGVPDQPGSEEETLTGALNRVKNAKEAKPDADFWVGLEGGIADFGDEMRTCAWIVVEGKDGRMGKSRTANFIIPKKVADLVREGKELGHADDIVFNDSNSKQKNGAVGILTNDAITREQLYEPSVVLALVPVVSEKFINNN